MSRQLMLFSVALLSAIVHNSCAFSILSAQRTQHYPKTSPLHSSSQVVNENEQHQDQQHSHSLLWETTIKESPDSYVNPAIELAIRPPEEGGTGIVAVDDVEKDSVVLCLPLEQVGMIDAGSILGAAPKGEDAVFDMLNEMWAKQQESTEQNEKKNDTPTQEGKRLAVLVGIIAHLQLTRYKDKTAWTSNIVKEGYALEESRRLGQFLDAMPLLPQQSTPNEPQQHPFPTHFLYWDDDEIEHLLQGTMAQTKAREVRAGVGLVLREWSAAFLKEHSGGVKQSEILNAIFSAFTAVLSRSFGDDAGRDLDGAGRMLVPLVDMLNHDSEDPNVSWQWHVGGDEIKSGGGDIAVTTLRDVKKGEELYKCYGWRPAWDIASSYGFVPRLKKERWECSVIPLFPAVLDLAPDVIAMPSQISKEETSLDLLLESNYGNLVKAVLAAVDAANEIEARQASENDDGKSEEKRDRPPAQLERLEVVSLFRPPPTITASDFPFPRRQPCVVCGTKIGASDQISSSNQQYHQEAIDRLLPAFRAAASAIAQLRLNHKNGNSSSSVQASQMAMAAASLDKDTDWDDAALELMRMGVIDRIKTIELDAKTANTWLSQSRTDSPLHRQFRAEMAIDIRKAELNVLHTLESEIKTRQKR